MTDIEQNVVEKALTRLEDVTETACFVELWEETENSLLENHVDLRLPLAALIRKAAEPMRRPMDSNLYCRACGARVDWDHAPDCALVALCRAVVGEQ